MQSTHKAVRACKWFPLHHSHIESAMEIRVNSLQTLPLNNSCTNANYIWARNCGNGEAKNANSPFVQSTHKAVRSCKLFLLRHLAYRIGNGNSRKFPAIYHGTIVALMQTTYEQDAVGIGRPKTQTLRLCNQRTKR